MVDLCTFYIPLIWSGGVEQCAVKKLSSAKLVDVKS
jgi:hypothetical protein